jgi:4-amino-4-deoxy-L-arabinose transferase-like glycosyltransferase
MTQVYGQPEPDPRASDAARVPQADVVDGEARVVEGEVIESRERVIAIPGIFSKVSQPPRIRASGCIGGFALVLLCLLVFLPGFFSIPVVDRDEARFAQASRQMYESVALAPALQTSFHDGGLVIPKVQDRPRLNKPPLIYWLQSASAGLFSRGNPYRDAIWMYRIPSLIAAIVAVLTVYRLGTRMFDRRTGWLAAALLAVSPVIAWEAHQARADMVLLACTTVAMAALWDCYARGRGGEDPSESSWKPALSFWIALSLGILTKGPITPLVVLLTILALGILAREWRWLGNTRPLLGIPLTILIVAPWVWAVGEKVGWDTYLATIRGETIGRSLSTREGHWGPPGYHTILLPVLFWPGSLLTAAGIALAFRAARDKTRATDRGVAGSALSTSPSVPRSVYRSLRTNLRWDLSTSESRPYAFCLAWLLPSWILFELVTTKLPHYTMPLYPAIALISARAVLAAQAGAVDALKDRGQRLGFRIWIAIGVAFCALAPIVVAVLGGSATPVSPLVWLGPLIAVFLTFYLLRRAVRAYRSRSILRCVLVAVALAALVEFVIFSFILPNGWTLWISRQIASTMRHHGGGNGPAAVTGYTEDSLVFLTRASIDFLQPEDLMTWCRSHPDGIVFASHEDWQRAAITDVDEYSRWKVGYICQGFNYSKGRDQILNAYIHQPPTEAPRP